MSPQPPVSITPNAASPGIAESPIVARYEGVLSLSIERSSFTIVDADKAQKNRAAFLTSPGFSSAPDPPRDARLEQLLMARLAAAVEFGSQLTGTSRDALSEAIDRRWPAVAKARQARDAGTAKTVYERVVLDGIVRADGTAEWGYTYGSGGTAIPVQAQAAPSASGVVAPRSEYELYIQNQMRADLVGR